MFSSRALVVVLAALMLFHSSQAFTASRIVSSRTSSALFAEVEVQFPNKKKIKAPSGTPLKDLAKKAGYKPNYGCEEGKCGSCEVKNGAKKVRICTGKAMAGMVLTEP